MTEAISIRNLTKSYGRVQALRGVDMDVRRGEVFGFLGPNGAGKTTAIRCMLDVIRPSGGTVRVLGVDPQADPVAVRARTGYLPGELHLDDNLTAGQALRWFDAFRGGGADWGFVAELTRRLGLKVDVPIKSFSKGNKQKVGIVQAFMHRPELLLLDEPTSGLDPLVQQEVLRLVREAQGRGATVFFSSHVLSEVQEVAGRVAIVRRGRIVEVASPESLTDRDLVHVTVTFAGTAPVADFAGLEGVKSARGDGARLRLEVTGGMDALVKALARYRVERLETERPTLEEIFLAYYADTPADTGGPS